NQGAVLCEAWTVIFGAITLRIGDGRELVGTQGIMGIPLSSSEFLISSFEYGLSKLFDSCPSKVYVNNALAQNPKPLIKLDENS
ncbi:MAG: hypothetical protein R3264_05015, partial [Anaerolineae bacterium]|nr:hypothetical protein [Anaerolineae bacterium]